MNSASIDGAVSSDVIGYFQVITCFDRALSLDTCWIQQALWEKIVSTPCRERVNWEYRLATGSLASAIYDIKKVPRH
jgi:hypothetical protein